jgi:deoxyribodipyrimidine photo-lyase
LNTALVWFRRDLRISDNPALAQALAEHECVIPVYLHSPGEDDPWTPGPAQQVWLHHSLLALDSSLRKRGSRLIIRHGKSLAQLRLLAAETGAVAVYWNRLYEPQLIDRDQQLLKALETDGLAVQTFNSALLHEPWAIKTTQDGPYKVYTPFSRSLRQLGVEPPQAVPNKLPIVPTALLSELVDGLQLLPKARWDRTLVAHWQPGEHGAKSRLRAFLKHGLGQYHEGRNLPAEPLVSRLSPHLHFGEIGPRQVWHAVQRQVSETGACAGMGGVESFQKELIWREFAYHLLYHFPHTTEQALDRRFSSFPWLGEDQTSLHAWQHGQTGIPIVDAGMRELWNTGWMHNRVRMIVASFLTKNLLTPWQEGARWFWHTLFDADLASNTLGWQWTAGCGADAAPYFRIFNPVLQAVRFDPKGHYLRHWVPELSKLPNQWIHQPWKAPEHILHEAGLALGKHYPKPIVDLAESRQRALNAYATLRENTAR